MQLRLELQADGESVFGFYGDGNALLKPDADLVEKIRHLLLTGVQYLANAAKLPDGISLPRDSSQQAPDAPPDA